MLKNFKISKITPKKDPAKLPKSKIIYWALKSINFPKETLQNPFSFQKLVKKFQKPKNKPKRDPQKLKKSKHHISSSQVNKVH